MSSRGLRRGGSSPRGRGKLQAPGRAQPRGGLIPAWAGKTRGASGFRGGRRAHPRVGGENSRPGKLIGLGRGSSPRGRGKRACTRVNLNVSGLIPAWAGKTRECTHIVPNGAAHPRVGGENPGDPLNNYGQRGSSPRGRGKLRNGHSPSLPALAHPRVGGENSKRPAQTSRPAGSSPRGRGKPVSVGRVDAREGLIPAWAGKTLGMLDGRTRMPAHPRVGGENLR